MHKRIESEVVDGSRAEMRSINLETEIIHATDMVKNHQMVKILQAII